MFTVTPTSHPRLPYLPLQGSGWYSGNLPADGIGGLSFVCVCVCVFFYKLQAMGGDYRYTVLFMYMKSKPSGQYNPVLIA
jgi:hypothetical protein